MFQSYKCYHQEYYVEHVTWGGVDFDKADFLSILQRMSDHTLKARVIRSSEAKAGLFSFNPQVVPNQMAIFVFPIALVKRPVMSMRKTQPFIFFSCYISTYIINLQYYSAYIDKRTHNALLVKG